MIRILIILFQLSTMNLFALKEDIIKRINNLAVSHGGPSLNEYSYIANKLENAPCNMLIFGFNETNGLWRHLNPKGLTVFLDGNYETVRKINKFHPDIKAFHLKYNSNQGDWKELLNQPNSLLLELPKLVNQTSWDIIIVIGPSNNPASKVKSIFSAASLAKKSQACSVFVINGNREIESTCCDEFLGKENLTASVDQLRHYLIQSPIQTDDQSRLSDEVQTNDEPISILIRSKWNDELEMASHLKVAASNIGWNVNEEIYYPGTESVVPKGVNFTLNLSPALIPPTPGIKNYALISRPYLLDGNGYFLKNLSNFDGLLITLQNIEPIKRQFKDLNRPLSYMQWHPTVSHIPYKKTEPKKLAHVISHWRKGLNDNPFKELYSLLDQAKYCHFYSVDEKNEELYPNSYVGKIACDEAALINTLSENGIALVMHSDIRNQMGIPSGRIFEAAAASCVIISDSNSFVAKHFDDTVLYFDHTKDPLTMFNQIDAHMNWILNNPEKAMEMGKQAHDIFERDFILENQLLKLEKLYQTK